MYIHRHPGIMHLKHIKRNSYKSPSSCIYFLSALKSCTFTNIWHIFINQTVHAYSFTQIAMTIMKKLRVCSKKSSEKNSQFKQSPTYWNINSSFANNMMTRQSHRNCEPLYL